MRQLTQEQRLALMYINKYQVQIWIVIKGVLNDHYLAEDAYQETVIRFIRNFNRVRTAVEWEMLAYLKTIAQNAALTIYKKHYKVGLTTDDELVDYEDHSGSVEEIVINRETGHIMYRMIMSLEYKYSAPLLLHVRHEMSYREIAKVLGITVDTARKRVHRARERLKAMYAAERRG